MPCGIRAASRLRRDLDEDRQSRDGCRVGGRA
jgi:hypothetical protein